MTLHDFTAMIWGVVAAILFNTLLLLLRLQRNLRLLELEQRELEWVQKQRRAP